MWIDIIYTKCTNVGYTEKFSKENTNAGQNVKAKKKKTAGNFF